MNSFTKWWMEYWFGRGSAFDLALLRIACVGFVLYHFWGNSVWERAAFPAALYHPPVYMRLLVGSTAPSPDFMWIVHAITQTIGVAALMGLFTTFSITVFAFGALLIQCYMYAFGDFHHFGAAVHIGLFALAMSPSGAALSIDSFVRGLRAENLGDPNETNQVRAVAERAILAPRLIAIILALVYFSAAISKFFYGDNGSWANGYTLQYYLVQDGLRFDRPLGLWMAQFHGFAVLSSYMTLFFEGTFWIVVFVRRLGPLYVLGGVVFHTVIYLTQEANFFSYYALYFALLPVAAALLRLRDLDAVKQHRLAVRYDPHCMVSRRLVAALSYFDWLGRLELREGSEAKADAPTTLRVGAGRETPDSGIGALRRCVRGIPPLWPILPLLFAPRPLSNALSATAHRKWCNEACRSRHRAS